MSPSGTEVSGLGPKSVIVQNCLQSDVCAEVFHISLQVVCHKIGRDGTKLSDLAVLLPQSLLAAPFYKTEGFFLAIAGTALHFLEG